LGLRGVSRTLGEVGQGLLEEAHFSGFSLLDGLVIVAERTLRRWSPRRPFRAQP
jgi:hypothetical protein